MSQYTRRRVEMKSTVAIVAVAALAGTTSIAAQWLNYPSSDTPRTKDGKANLSARTPKTRDGKPDLSGVWRAQPDPQGKPEGVENEIFPRYFANTAKDLTREEMVLHPSGINTFPSAYMIVQQPRLVTMLYEEGTTYRQIFLDGRPLPKDPNPSFMGYSVGRWEADALVVESVGLRNDGWLDRMGHPHSDQLHLIERRRRRDFGHLSIETTIDDPNIYAKAFTYTLPVVLLPDTDVLEYYCTDNEKDVRHFR